jgi:hypothetical protein
MSQLDVKGGSADEWLRRLELFIAQIRLTRRSKFRSRGGS